MRILYHQRTLGDGAEQIHVDAMVNALSQLGQTVHVTAPVRSASGTAPSLSLASRVLRAAGPLYDVAELAYNLRAVQRLSADVRRFRPDVIYERYAKYNYAGVFAAERYGIPLLLEVNCPYSDVREQFDEPVYFPGVRRRIEADICGRAAAVFVVSTPIKAYLEGLQVPADKIVVLPNGADPELFSPGPPSADVRREWGLTGKTVVGFTGILRPWHGVDLLVAAFKSIADRRPDAHLLIVGDGPVRLDIEAAVRRDGLTGRVTITGRQPHAQVRQFIAVMDVAVSPRATRYASPMKLVEYMAVGKAVVAPDMPNMRDLIAPGVTGTLFQAENADSMATAIGRLLADPALRAQLGTAARASVERERNWRYNARSVIEIMEMARSRAAAARS